MTPYYERDGITLYHGDCREILPTLPKVDLVLTDPPYGIADKPMLDLPGRGRGNNTYHPLSTWDLKINPEWCELVSVAAPVVAWFGHWRKRTEVEAAMRLPIRAEIVWAKDCHVGPPCPVAMRDERLWLFSGAGITGRKFETSVWDVPIIPTWEHKHHKNEKPVALLSRAVAFLSDAGQTILDPFTGSGTTLVAAKRLGRRAIGIEIEERYCAIAAARLEAERLTLFETAPQHEQLGLM
jgi:DNA modification methylase